MLEVDQLCDKCGRPVTPRNNAVIYQAEAGEISWETAACSQPRHLAPEEMCEGSPSRFQHITGHIDGRGFSSPTLQSLVVWREACCRINGEDCPCWCQEKSRLT